MAKGRAKGKKTKRRKGISQKAMHREAVKILNARNSKIKRVNGHTWQVRSRSNPEKWHTVKMSGSGLECTCSYCQKRNKARCVHGTAIEMLILQDSLKMKPGNKKVVIDNEIPLQCPKGHTRGITKAGHRPRVHRDAAQLYWCPKCKNRFTGDEIGFEGRHYGPEIILRAVWLFNIGTSPETIALTLKTQENTVVNETTIERWAKDYNIIVEEFTRDLPIQTGGIWTVDEKLLTDLKAKLNDNPDAPERKQYLFTMLDQYTRFLLAFHLAGSKDNYNANHLFKTAKERAGCTPIILKSDKLPAFCNACTNVFCLEIGSETIHWCDCHMRGEFKETNGQERANSTWDSLIRSKRSLKSVGSMIIRGAMLFYNYYRPHKGIDGKTPAEMAKIIIRGTDPQKTLIQNGVLKQRRKK